MFHLKQRERRCKSGRKMFPFMTSACSTHNVSNIRAHSDVDVPVQWLWRYYLYSVVRFGATTVIAGHMYGDDYQRKYDQGYHHLNPNVPVMCICCWVSLGLSGDDVGDSCSDRGSGGGGGGGLAVFSSIREAL